MRKRRLGLNTDLFNFSPSFSVKTELGREINLVFVALAYIFAALTDLLFESGVFANYAKIEKIQLKKD